MRTVIRKRYSEDFKAQAVGLLDLGRSVPEVAEELGIGNSILYRWARAAAPAPQPPGAARWAEVREGRRLESCATCASRTPTCSWRMTF